MAAVNKAGQGPYSLPNTPVEIKEPGCKPEVLEHLQDVTVTSPEVARLTCRVNVGEPRGKVTWLKNGEKVKESRAEMKQDGDHVTLTLNESKVKDAAEYKVIVENKRGCVESSCTLDVLCKYTSTYNTVQVNMNQPFRLIIILLYYFCFFSKTEDFVRLNS